ncbi:MAG: PilZ domain-containing protein [Phycisphaerales bacterium JB039]
MEAHDQFSARAGAADPQSACRRRFGRIRVGNVRCTLGRVMDISAGGMRVLNRSMNAVRPGATVPVQVETDQGWVQATVRVAWVRPAGVFRQEMGLELMSIDDDGRRALMELANKAGASQYRLMREDEAD